MNGKAAGKEGQLYEGDRIIMNRKSNIRTILFIFAAGLLMFGLTSCRLSASKGPVSTSEGFPVPGSTEQGGGIDVTKFATQTARAMLPVVIAPGNQGTNSAGTPYPLSSEAPAAPTVTPTPITYIQPTPGGLPQNYTLQEGEYPFCIARRFDVNQGELLTLNNLTMESYFYAGQELKIPQTGNPFEGTRMLIDHPTLYTVKAGETLGSIACHFGDISPDLIAAQNNLSSNEVSAGTQLVIP